MKSNSQAQSLSDFQWENRLLVIFEGKEKSIDYTNQINEILLDKAGLKERKLLLLKVVNNTIFDQNGNSYDSKMLGRLSKLRSKKEEFEVVLIGLDGGVKLRKSTTVSLKNLFALIDGMPMRRAEIKNQKN